MDEKETTTNELYFTWITFHKFRELVGKFNSRKNFKFLKRDNQFLQKLAILLIYLCAWI